MEELALIELAQRGDKKAYGALMEKQHDRTVCLLPWCLS